VKWYQLHLSTLLALMLLAGGLVWLNVREQTVVITDALISEGRPARTFTREIRLRGWPSTFESSSRESHDWNCSALVLDVALCLLLLALAGAVVEWATKLRTKRIR
jgi:hypothetical protein